MNKKVLLFLMTLLSATLTYAIGGKQFYKAKVVYKHGDVETGLINFVNGETKDFISYKQSEDSKVEKVEVSKLAKVIYIDDSGEYEYAPIMVYAGWKQVKIKGPIWLGLVKKGVASLYMTTTVLSSPTMISSTGVRSEGGSATFKDYYIIRDGEPAAKLIATISTMNNNQTYKAKAPLYFSDYPELAKKIKKKEYTWKNLEEVVDIYNKWAQENK